jgi:hypothetical protein
VVVDKSGKLWLRELNTNPDFGYFLTDNEPEILEEMYGGFE